MRWGIEEMPFKKAFFLKLYSGIIFYEIEAKEV